MNEQIDTLLKQRAVPKAPKDLAYNIIQQSSRSKKKSTIFAGMFIKLTPVYVLASALFVALILNMTFLPLADMSLSNDEMEMVFASLNVQDNFDVDWLSDRPLSEDEIDAVFDTLFIDGDDFI